MRMSRKVCFIAIVAFLLSVIGLSAAPLAPDSTATSGEDSLRISLITCYPGDEIYQLFGHTALRVQQTGDNPFDWAFNYGMFSFDSGNFVYRFTKGETDYMLGVYDFEDFMVDYVMRGSTVVEQELNLTQEEKAALMAALVENAAPQNRVYRYNFLFDNCATRPRDRIEAAVEGSIDFGSAHESLTFRDEIHRYGRNYEWFMFGVDLALGKALDDRATWREQMFVPMILQDAFNQAVVSRPDSLQKVAPLVCRETLLFESDSSPVLPPTPWYLSPVFVALLLLAAAGFITYVNQQYRRVSRWFDAVFYGFCFVGGCIIYFLVFFSEHPATTINLNALWLSPFALIAALFPYVAPLRVVAKWYHWVNLGALALFLIIAALQIQHFNIAVYPLVAVSILRSYNYIAVCRASARNYKPASLHRNE